jgi:diguanylate cyclase (GGDEF)-like protein/PAS domain S-box-containing protein
VPTLTRFLRTAFTFFRHEPKTAVVLGIIMAVSLGILSGLLHSVGNLYSSLAQVRSISVDVQALGVDGELQYQIQESRIRFLHMMIPATSGEDRLSDIARVREADLKVSLLTGKAALLNSGPARLQPFSQAWGSYDDIKDDMIALGLQGRFAEALAMEKAQGTVAFNSASDAIRRAKQQLALASATKLAAARSALQRACLEVLGLLAASAICIAALFAGEVRRRGIMRRLLSATQTLRESEGRFRNVFEEAAVGIVVTDLDGTIVSVNNAVQEITQYSRHDLTARPVQFLMSNRDKHATEASLEALKRGDLRTYRAERQIVRKDGTSAFIRTSVSLARKDGHPANVIALCEDISEQRLAQDQLRYQAKYDALTGLPNRAHFEEALQRELTAAGARGGEIALLYLDLDGFKLVNDTLGHGAGDALLREVAKRLARALSPGEILARAGGDEFAIVVPFPVPEHSSLHAADGAGRPEAALAETLLDVLKHPFTVNHQDIHIGASMGISRFPIDGTDAGTLLQNADSAMYCAKRDKQGYHFFDKRMHEAARRRSRIGSQLAGALERRELSVEFQPLYDLATSALIRFEALCRWQSRELGVVPPSEFIPVAEEIGLIGEIGRYVLRQACTEALRWRETDRPPVSIAVNVSPAQFRRKLFVEEVAEILSETSLPARLLELEITESTLMGDLDESVRRMHRLRAMGIGISIDDFGTGYSSLSCLQNMPVEALKIDRSFVSRLDQDGASVPMIRSIIAMGHALGLRVVSEGVENERQLKILTDLGSDEGQGYYFGKSEVAAKALARVLRECPAPALAQTWV